MINTSNEYKSRIRKNRKFYRKSTVELANSNVLNLVDTDFINDGFRIDDSVGEKVAVGTVVVNKCTYFLNNFDGKFDSYDFTGAVIRPQAGLQLSETIEYLAKGVFTVDNPGAKGSIIILEALDNMAKFDVSFSEVTISFPCTVLQLLQAVSLHGGVSIATSTFTNYNLTIANRPTNEATSCREIVAWIAQMAGCFARCDVNGALELKWYDMGAFESETVYSGGVFDGLTVDEQYGLPIGTMESAGRNLLLKSDFKDGMVGWWGGDALSESYLGKNSILKDYTAATSGFAEVVGKNLNTIPLNVSTWYTVSFYTKGIGKVDSYIYPNAIDTTFKGYVDGIEKALSSDGNSRTTLTNNWERHTYTFKTKATLPATYNLLFRVFFGNAAYICMPKLEEGLTATPWTPAPEDILPYATGDNLNGGTFSDYNSGDTVDGGTFTNMDRYHHIYSFNSNPNIGTDDIVITGVRVTDTSEPPNTVLFGATGYVLPIEGNQLIQDGNQATAIANSVGAKIVGMKFRAFSGSAQSDPSIEAGDVALVSDRKGNSYQVMLTSIDYSPGSYQSLSCGAETPARNSYRPTPEMKAIIEARKVAKNEINSYDLAVQQFTNLITNGFGLFRTEIQDETGGTIYYMHDKKIMGESSIRWYMSTGGMIEQNRVNGSWVTVSGTDKNGNALYNVITARGIDAQWIKVLSSFTVGSNFSVDSTGKLTASEADISGKITSTFGEIAGMTIGPNGLAKISTRTVNSTEETFIGELWLQNGGFNISFNDLLNTYGCGINVYYNTAGEPLLNLYARDANGLANDNILLNGQPILGNFTSLLNRVTMMENFLIQQFEYNPYP